MYKKLNKIKFGTIGVALSLTFIGTSTVLALPTQATAHAQGVGAANAATSNNSAPVTSQNVSGNANGQAHMAAGQLTACQNRQAAISNIMSRIDTRAQNQIYLFNTIATRVENFYTKQGKTLSNYDQLVAAVNAAKTQAQTDFATLQSGAKFSCSSSNPKGMVTSFQSYLKTEISDLQNYRTAVKNLTSGVATANGVALSGSSQTSATQGAQ